MNGLCFSYFGISFIRYHIFSEAQINHFWTCFCWLEVFSDPNTEETPKSQTSFDFRLFLDVETQFLQKYRAEFNDPRPSRKFLTHGKHWR